MASTMVVLIVTVLRNDEESQEKWTRITLRLPSHLHRKLTESAGPLSLNAAIVQRLIDSFSNYEDVRKAIVEDLKLELKEMLDDLRKDDFE